MNSICMDQIVYRALIGHVILSGVDDEKTPINYGVLQHGCFSHTQSLRTYRLYRARNCLIGLNGWACEGIGSNDATSGI
jgi:hypothetical protein